MAKRTLVVVNPRSQAGATRRRFADLEPRLRAELGDLEVEWTRGPRDAERIAREGVRAGVERVIVAGGDGTMSEVVTGLLAAGLGGYAKLALLPLGTGGDLPRTLGIPRRPEQAIEAIARGVERRLDAGRVSYRRADGGEAASFFLNIASAGMGGLVCRLVDASPKFLGGRVSFLVGTLRALARYASPPVRVRLDGVEIHDGPITLLAAANGRYFGGGMFAAPGAQPDDGLFDVVVIPGYPKARLLRELPGLYRGTHVDVDGVKVHRGTRLEAEVLSGAGGGAGNDVWIEVDGEPLGSLPARFELLPGAVTFVGSDPS